MADFGDDDFYDDDYGDDWLYVEDEFDLADELAETQIASPGYAGTKYEVDVGGYEFELFDYWNDLEYADVALWDGDGDGQFVVRKAPAKQRKRKRPGGQQLESSEALRQHDPIRFWSRADREHLALVQTPNVDSSSTYALIPDWRTRLAGEPKLRDDLKQNEDVFEAAVDAESDLGEDEEGFEDEELEEEEKEEGASDDDGGLAIDPAILQAILKEKLGQAGLEGMDEAAFMQTIGKLLSGDGQAEDAAGDLAKALLAKLDDGDENGAMSGWLSGQGVSLNGADKSEQEGEHENAETSKEYIEAKSSTTTRRSRDAQTSRKRAREDEPTSQASTEKRSRHTGRQSRPPR